MKAKQKTTKIELSRTANDCARAILAHIEKTLGKELHLKDCVNIAAVIQCAINEEVGNLREMKEQLRESLHCMVRHTPSSTSEAVAEARDHAKFVLSETA